MPGPNTSHAVLVLGETITVYVKPHVGVEWWEAGVTGQCVGWDQVGVVVWADDNETPLLVPWTSVSVIGVDRYQHPKIDAPPPF